MKFTLREQQFYDDLLVKHFLEKCETGTFKSMKLYLKGIEHEMKFGKSLLTSLEEHRMNLALLMENIYQKREDAFRDTHRHLNMEVGNYTENFKFIKEKLFELVQEILNRLNEPKVTEYEV
jgi:hypothetical protein